MDGFRLGVMVSIGDYSEIDVPELDFTELLLFDGDLIQMEDEVVERLRSFRPRLEFVHAQEFIMHRGKKELVDLSSCDEEIRSISRDAVSGAREIAQSLGVSNVVIHPGGIRRDFGTRDKSLENLRRSLGEIGSSRLLLENMPWFYWLHKKERMVSNVGVSQADMERLEDLVDGFTLDTCHGYLSSPEGDQGYCQRFLNRFGEKVRHIHVSDAAIPDREGLQIGDGEIDFGWLRGCSIPATVEIWEGHKNRGEGFRKGVKILRAMERQG